MNKNKFNINGVLKAAAKKLRKTRSDEHVEEYVTTYNDTSDAYSRELNTYKGISTLLLNNVDVPKIIIKIGKN